MIRYNKFACSFSNQIYNIPHLNKLFYDMTYALMTGNYYENKHRDDYHIMYHM